MPDKEINYGFGVDYFALYALGNAWIRLGDELHERTATMAAAVNGMQWTGSASTAMRSTWGAEGTDARGVTSLLHAARDNAYEIGGAIHDYARQVRDAERKADDARIVGIITWAVGAFLMGALGGIGHIAIIGRAFLLIDRTIGRLAGVIARMVPNSILGPGGRAVLERVLGYSTSAVLGAGSSLALDIAVDVAAHKIMGLEWKPNAFQIGLSVGLGAAFGAVGYQAFRHEHVPGSGGPVRQWGQGPRWIGPARYGGPRPVPAPVGPRPLALGHRGVPLLDPQAPVGLQGLPHAPRAALPDQAVRTRYPDGPEGVAARAEDWQSFQRSRDTEYRDRLNMEEAFHRRTGDRLAGDVDAAFGTVRRNAPDTAEVVEGSPKLSRQVHDGYRADLHDSFRTAWQSRSRDGQTDRAWDASWRLEAERLRAELPDRIAHVADRARRLDQFDTAFDGAVSQFRSTDLFRGSYLSRSSPDHTIRFDEASGTFVAHRVEGPLDRLRAVERARVEAAIDGAWRAAGNRRPTGEHAETADATIAGVHASLPDRLARLSDQERQVWHAERDFSSAYDTWHDSLEGGGLRPDTLQSTRQRFVDDVRQRHAGLDADRPVPDGRLWEHEYGSLLSDLPARLDRAAFHEHVQATGQRTLDEALAAHDAGSPLEQLTPEQRQRVTEQWRTDLSTVAEEHLTAGGQLWTDRYAQLRDDLPRQIRHELNKSDILRVAADDFRRLAGHPDDELSGARAEIPASLRDELAASFRGSTITRYDQIWSPRDVDSQAWLAHEGAGANAFAAALARPRVLLTSPPVRATPPDAAAPPTAPPTRQDGTSAHEDGTPVRQDDAPDTATATTQDLVSVVTERGTPRTDAGHADAALTPRQTQTQLVPEAPARLTSGHPTQAPTPRQEPVSPTRADALDQPSGTARSAEPQPTRSAYLDELDHALLPVPRYAYGEHAAQIYTERLGTLRSQYVEARAAADAHGPATTAEVAELRQGAATAAQHLVADSGRIAAALREFSGHYADLPPGVTRGSAAHAWYVRELDGVIHSYRSALIDQGRHAGDRLQEHFEAQARTLRVLARSDTSVQHAATPNTSSWQEVAWRAHRDELDTRYATALDESSPPQRTQVQEQVRQQDQHQPQESDDATPVRGEDTTGRPQDIALLDRYGERLHDSFDRAVASVETLLSDPGHPGTPGQDVTPGRELLVALDVTDADLAAATAHLRAGADRELRTAVARLATTGQPAAATVEQLDDWFTRRVEVLPAELVVDAARRAAVRDARDLADSIARGWATALPVAGRPFLDAFDARSGALSDDLRRAVADHHAAEVEARFTETFRPHLVTRQSATALQERLVEWAEHVRTTSDRLDRSLPVVRAAQQAALSAAALFDARTHDLDRPLTGPQRERLRQEFVAQARTAHAEAFAGHTDAASDLTARTWLWQASLERLAQRLPERIAFEAVAGDSLREAGAAYRTLVQDRDVDADRLEELATSYRQDWFGAVRTLWAPPDLPTTWLEMEERTSDAFTAGLTGLAEPEWRKSTRSVPAHEGEAVYCLEAAPLLVALGPGR